MIATLTGRLRRKLEDRVVVECGGLGYEVFLPPIAQRQIEHVTAGPGEKGSELVWEIMVKQLGHRPSEASQLITDALRRRPSIMSPEELFDEIYRGQKA